MWIYYQSLKIMYLNKTLIHISGYILYSAKTIQNQDKPDLNQRTYQLPNSRFILKYKSIMIGLSLTNQGYGGMYELNTDVKCLGDREEAKEREKYDRSRHCWTEKLGKWEEYIFGFGENEMSEKVEDEEPVTLVSCSIIWLLLSRDSFVW